MIRCWIPFETLADYHEGRADAVSAVRIKQHLDSGCTRCGDGLNWMSRVLPAMRPSEELVSAPVASLSRVQALYRERFRPAPRVPVAARFVFDSRTAPMPVLARNTGSTSYQLLYSTDEHDIDLWHEKQGERAWYLIGQVLPHSGGRAIVPDTADLRSREGRSHIAVPEMNEFHITAVPPGKYDLSLRFREVEISVPDIVIGA